ncbi:MAG: DUF4177 domain-containing protein [Desulforhopalus sp.]
MRWSYKTVHYELKKEGILGNSFLDEPEIELSLNQYGKAGWELVSMLETMDGIIAVFKQPLDVDSRSFRPRTDPPESVSRFSAVVGNKAKASLSREQGANGLESLDEDALDALLLDEFEVVEDKAEETDTQSSVPVVDVGLIRIE